jgi:hypothetical protein
MDKYLIKYLVENADNALFKKYIGFFKVELDWQIFISENHMSKAYHRNRKIGIKEKLLRTYQYTISILFSTKVAQNKKIKVLSTVHFPIKNAISDLGIESYSPVWHPLGKKNIFGDLKTLIWHKGIQNRIRNDDFHLFLEPKFHTKLEELQDHLLVQYQKHDFRALFLYTDEYFYSKFSIDIFKKMGRPSFIFTHGLPGIYSLQVDNKSDYLMVWSEKIRNNYINSGFNPSKIKVIGHPKYKELAREKSLTSDLSDVLIIPVSSVNWHQHEYENTVINDCSMVVLYLYKVQSVLKKMGIKQVRYRPHPILNRDWVHSFLDQEFFIRDAETLTDSLNRSSLVIGANSTVLLESLIQGVNYLAFDPKDENGINLSGYKAVPPFDGTEKKLMISNDEAELEKLLRTNAITDYSLVYEYIQDLDLSVLNEIIK